MSANPLRADLTRALARRPALTSTVELDQPQASILEGDESDSRYMARVLQAEGFLVRTFTSASQFMTQPGVGDTGCLIVNASLPDMTGLELQRELVRRQWSLPVIFLTPADDISTVVRGMKAGAINCLAKPVQGPQLLQAVREAFVASSAVHAQHAARLRVRQMLGRLTPREREVLDLAVAGLLGKQIAARLGTAERTIKTHKTRVMRKLQVRSTVGLLQRMITAGAFPVPPTLQEAAAHCRPD